MCACPLALTADNVAATQKAEIVTTPRSSSTPSPLLFAFVTAAFGYDTEITISNTSLDTLGTSAQAGTCVLTFSGVTNGASGSTPTSTSATTKSIAAGQQLVFNLSQGGGGIPAVPGFQGYIYADCSFPLARGLAKISYLGSQDAQPIAFPRSTANPQYLLLPFITAASGFDTGISLANTSPIDSSGQTGSCSLYVHGVSVAGSGTTPVSATLQGCDLLANPNPGVNCFPLVSPGSVGSVAASSVLPEFQGYAVAACRFTGAAGFAPVTSLGLRSGGALSDTPELLSVPRPSTIEPLLFSSISNQGGLDTGIAIANTGLDPIGTSGSSGSCTLDFYGANAPSPVSTGTIAAGSSYTALASAIAPGFQGYAIASCTFPYARGTSFRMAGGTPDGHSETAELVTRPRSLTPTPLLFSAVTNWTGFDTNFTISNTSQDTLGTNPSSGTCTMSYFGSMLGGGNLPAPQTSGTIQPGSQFSFSLSSGNAAQGIAGAPGFRGYVIADCNFPLARGLSDVVTVNPVLSITSTHTSSFTQGQAGAAYTVTVSNQGGSPASGTVTVTETVPSGLTLVSMAGTGWDCTTLPDCTRSDALPGGASYPPIAVTVNVVTTASSPQINAVSVSGGGAATANTTDSTTIIALPAILSIASAHSGNFAQGQTNATYTVTVSNAASTATTGDTVTVTETVPTGLTLVSMAGTGWTCTTLPTCTRNDVLNPGASYQAITVTVNVAANAPSSVTNQVGVSGGGSAPASASDATLVTAISPGQYLISTYAGGLPTATAATATTYPLGSVNAVATDQFGNTYASSSLHCVFRIDPNGILSRVAGTCTAGFSGDGGLAVNAQLNNPMGLAVDSAGNLYIADSGNYRVREVTPNGVITTVAGSRALSLGSGLGDNGPATSAFLDNPQGVAVDSAGNLYIADTYDSRIRKVTGGIITTVAGNGSLGYSGDGAAATSAELFFPQGVAVDSAGNLYIADTFNNRVRMVASNGNIATVAGNGSAGYSGDSGPAATAQLNGPQGVAVDSAGNLYIADTGNGLVRKVTGSGTIATVAGNGMAESLGDSGPATAALLIGPQGVAVDSSGNFRIADTGNQRVREVMSGGTIATLAGSGLQPFSGDGGPAALAQFSGLGGVAADATGNLYVADANNYRVRKINPAGAVSTIAGTGSCCYSGDGGAAASAEVNASAVAVDSGGNVYIAGGARVRKIATNGIITTVAGTGSAGYSGDNGPATSAQISSSPSGLAIDSKGNLYIADSDNQLIRKVTPAGAISTVAGTGTAGNSGDNGPGTSAQLNFFFQGNLLAVDAAGNLYIASTSGSLDGSFILQLATNGAISVFAGNGSFCCTGDGGAATSAGLGIVYGLAVDAAGNLYIGAGGINPFGGTNGYVVRKVSPGGIVSTVAGTSFLGYSGDGGPALSAQLGMPSALAVDSSGNVYVADSSNNLVRVLEPAGVAPLLTVSTSQTGNFTYGQNGATYSITVNNAPLAAPTSGTVKVTDPSGLTQISMAGDGWSCTSDNACTRSDSLAGGNSYPAIAVTGNVAANALPQVTSSVAVSGGGSLGAGAADVANVGAATAVLEIVSTHAGNFTPLQANATYTLAVGNQTAAAATSAAVTVTETLPAGLTLVSMAGTGWDCTTLPKCTRSDTLAGGASYPPITVTVDVTTTAASLQVNAVSASGGGSATASATDSTIVAAPSLSIASTHTGDFTPGQTNATYTVTVGNAASAVPTSGTVTVTETIPTGLSLVSMAGTGWICTTLPTCTRSDVLAAGSSYQAIIVTVNVVAGAGPQVINQVSVSGGGSSSASANDVTSISTLGSCDLKQDLSIRAADVQLIVNEALGVAPAVNSLTGGGVVSVVDVQIETNAALGLGCSGT